MPKKDILLQLYTLPRAKTSTSSLRIENNIIEDNIINDVRNRLRLKKQNEAIRDILSNQKEKIIMKKTGVDNFNRKSYIEY